MKFLGRGAFSGEAFLVNPSLPEVAGFVSLASIEALPHPVDAAFVALGTKGALEAVRELAAGGTQAAIVLASGFSESGAAGEELQRSLALAAGSMRLLGPNTLGAVNLTDGVFLSASDALETPGITPGAIGVASQSGGMMASLLSRAAGHGIGFSKLFATGNEADLEVADCIEYFVDDDATSVIALYLETVRRPDRFLAAAQLATRAGKPIVCFKVGRSEAGARAAASHTGALAGSDRIYDALFDKVGVRRVERFSELLEVPAALATNKRLGGNRIGVLTTTGGGGTLIADACGALGLELSAPDAALVAALEHLLPGGGSDLAHNPIDLTLAGTRPEVMTPVIEALTATEAFDGVVVVVGSSAVALPRMVADPLIACANKPGAKPIFAFVSPHLPEVIDRLNRNGVPAFAAPEGCGAALAALLGERIPSAPRKGVAPRATTAGGEFLNEDAAKELLAGYGIHSPRRIVAASAEDAVWGAAELREPLAVKVLASGLAHKSDVGGVALGVGHSELAQVATRLLANIGRAGQGVRVEGILVEEMAAGTEVLLGMVRDGALGPAILLGSGGLDAELIDDTVICLPPVDLAEARAMIKRLRIAPALHGARGRERLDVDALAGAIVAFGAMIQALGESLAEIEINPLVVLPAGAGVLALDALVRFDPALA